MSVICGDLNPTAGEILVHGQAKKFSGPHKALEIGILSVPRERRVESIVPEMPVYENIAMSNYERVKKNGLISSNEAGRRLCQGT